ncbi:prephenate dehydrogenase [Mobilisporobacter senegalensis]|uniref:Prephenate dehydrogenase n=1 Tax=Mobilisporobacter senegalensis TaxID=1329262 RepID=A0A3N1XQT3_9FIRM|nr:prephenate dehydrogenase [Mobilisporobacter senegalensis]ROR27147.1 prephenate dehydrogenase [Mobilisporobacter senegalensis]
MGDITAGFIGFGLIGGSIARAMRELYPNATLVAYNHNKDVPNKSLELAQEEQILDKIYTDLSVGFSKCDIIFLCAPVLTNIEYLKQLKSIIKPSCILTDVGSVKGNIHEAVTNLDLDANFIGGHPMAGSEKAGFINSNSKLLENAYYILTPTAKTSDKKLEFIYSLVEDMGALPLILDYMDHDNIVAAISHVPHIIAASLVNLVKKSDSGDEKMRALAAGGFKDITRIASSSPIMWQNICLTNTKSIKGFLDQYILSLQDISSALNDPNEDFLYEVFDTAREYRDSIPNKAIGMMAKIHEVYLDIIDEAGAIATIATILASNNISIKNIGIIHNREFQDGVLRIEFYNEESSAQAVDLLRKYRYTIYER